MKKRELDFEEFENYLLKKRKYLEALNENKDVMLELSRITNLNMLLDPQNELEYTLAVSANGKKFVSVEYDSLAHKYGKNRGHIRLKVKTFTHNKVKYSNGDFAKKLYTTDSWEECFNKIFEIICEHSYFRENKNLNNFEFNIIMKVKK